MADPGQLKLGNDDEVIAWYKQMLDAVRLPRLAKKERARTAKAKDQLLRLIETARRGDDPARTRGIGRGASCSPTYLDAVLHYWLDRPLAGNMEFPLILCTH